MISTCFSVPLDGGGTYVVHARRNVGEPWSYRAQTASPVPVEIRWLARRTRARIRLHLLGVTRAFARDLGHDKTWGRIARRDAGAS